MPNWAAVIMAAGKGTRMKSKLPKVMHPLAGKPMLQHVLETVDTIQSERSLVILGHGRDYIEKWLEGRAQVVVQAEQLGTGHAMMQAIPHLGGVKNIMVLSGDQPLIRPETLAKLMELHESHGAAATILTAHLDNPYGLGRIVKNGDSLSKIVEEKDATEEERKIQEINTGTYCFDVEKLREALKKVTPQNAQGEYYLTDVFRIFLTDGETIQTFSTSDRAEALGINSRAQLAQAEQLFRNRILEYWMSEGVTIIDPATTFIDSEVVLERDCMIEPFTILKGKTKIEEDALIGPYTQLTDCICKSSCEINHTVGHSAIIGKNAKVGPFAYLRPGTVLEANVKIGDFVEIKNSFIGEGSKVPHLSYIGDSELGKSVNVGAGTITCNYDGVHKHRTKIGNSAFIGSNTNLVAPVEVGDHAIIGAGSTISKNVPSEALAVERSTQIIKEQWAKNKK